MKTAKCLVLAVAMVGAGVIVNSCDDGTRDIPFPASELSYSYEGWVTSKMGKVRNGTPTEQEKRKIVFGRRTYDGYTVTLYINNYKIKTTEFMGFDLFIGNLVFKNVKVEARGDSTRIYCEKDEIKVEEGSNEGSWYGERLNKVQLSLEGGLRNGHLTFVAHLQLKEDGEGLPLTIHFTTDETKKPQAEEIVPGYPNFQAAKQTALRMCFDQVEWGKSKDRNNALNALGEIVDLLPPTNKISEINTSLKRYGFPAQLMEND